MAAVWQSPSQNVVVVVVVVVVVIIIITTITITIVSALQQSARREKNEVLRTRLHEIKNSLTLKT